MKTGTAGCCRTLTSWLVSSLCELACCSTSAWWCRCTDSCCCRRSSLRVGFGYSCLSYHHCIVCDQCRRLQRSLRSLAARPPARGSCWPVLIFGSHSWTGRPWTAGPGSVVTCHPSWLIGSTGCKLTRFALTCYY